MTANIPKISFGIIVLNGEPFTLYCLRSLYPFAHEIIVVEGANGLAKTFATKDGHSTDGTLETLYKFKREEDHENKLKIVTRDGFWTEKDEQSQAYAKVASGNYLWQIDIDEFYDPEQMHAVINFLQEHPEISMVSFKQITFWGGFDYVCDGWYLRRGAVNCNRIFRWGLDYRYINHRPPTVIDESGQNMNELRPILLEKILKRPLFFYHYSLIFPQQVIDKCEYSRNVTYTDQREALDWANDVFFKLKKPFRVHNVYQTPSWLERFHGKHPPQIQELRKNLQSGKIKIEIRKTDDIETLLNNRSYQLGRVALKIWGPLDEVGVPIFVRIKKTFRHPVHTFIRMRQKSAQWLKQRSG